MLAYSWESRLNAGIQLGKPVGTDHTDHTELSSYDMPVCLNGYLSISVTLVIFK